jgi:hypothetical protein
MALIEDRALCEPGHYKVDHFEAVEPGVQHIHAHEDLGKLVALDRLWSEPI